MPRFIERAQRPLKAPVDGAYPINIDLEYRLLGFDRTLLGCGTTKTMSRNTIVFASEEALPKDVGIELALSWPAQLDNTIPLKLQVFGTTTRVNGNVIEVTILRYEFRTAASRSPFNGRTV
jgi:hypothetical protein